MLTGENQRYLGECTVAIDDLLDQAVAAINRDDRVAETASRGAGVGR
jgi:hypothetical protein